MRHTPSSPRAGHGPATLSAESLLVDAPTLRVVDANQAACNNLGYTLAELTRMTVDALLPDYSSAALAALLTARGKVIDSPATSTRQRRADGSLYPVRLRLVWVGTGRVLLLGEDISAQEALASSRDQFQARFEAIVSHTPGMVYQFELHAGGKVAFPYLSEGCAALLGMSAAALRRRPGQMLQLILPEDRRSYLDAMHASASAMTPWNWEGRIWIDAWKDVKWINLRATPRRGPHGVVQWEGIMSNITDSRVERIAVRRDRAQLAELAAHTEQVREQERTRIAREIHDDLGGNLTAIKMALAMLAARLPPGDALLREKADYVDALADRSIDAVHRIAQGLRPSIIDLGINAALEWQLKEFERQAGLACSFATNDSNIDLGLDQATALFRIFQEALTNIARHAHASRVRVRLQRLRRHVSLRIADNGSGIAPQDRNKPHSFGLRGMRERAEAFGGTLAVTDAAGGGTVVTIKIELSSAGA